MKNQLFLVIAFVFMTSTSIANNLIIGTPSINGSTITFSIAWNNSWKVTTGPSNWDAVWVFIKRQACDQNNQNPWLHGVLASSGHSTTSSQLGIDLASDNMGVFIKRSEIGIGNITQTNVTLTLASAIGADNIKIIGVEMVYVPQGQFYIGDGHPSAGDNVNFTDGNTFDPKLITAAIQAAGIGASSTYSRANSGSTVALPSTFPLGYNSFYCMKYEITAELYVSFLNTLTYNQQLRLMRNANATPPESAVGTLINNTYNGYRIEIVTPGAATTELRPAVFGNDATDNNSFNQSDDGLALPVGLGTRQFLSFLDWAALRPMTEFEFEKACRGTQYPVIGEYAWGTTDHTNFSNYSISNRFTSTEVLSGAGLGMGNVSTNINYRVGIAATATSNRVKAGATYYGILDMTGGMGERVVGWNGTDYSTFSSANHGNGILNSAGSSDVTGWIENTIGSRGFSWHNTWNGFSISNRNWNHYGRPSEGTDNGDNWAHFGGRGIRTY